MGVLFRFSLMTVSPSVLRRVGGHRLVGFEAEDNVAGGETAVLGQFGDGEEEVAVAVELVGVMAERVAVIVAAVAGFAGEDGRLGVLGEPLAPCRCLGGERGELAVGVGADDGTAADLHPVGAALVVEHDHV